MRIEVWVVILSMVMVIEAISIYPQNITVSGISSGGAMATQLQVAYSKTFRGMGIIASPPYACSYGNIVNAVVSCLKHPSLISLNVIYGLVALGDGITIDSTSNLKGVPIWGYSGTHDSVVESGSVVKNMEFFTHYQSKVMLLNNISSEHAWITNSYGNDCSVLGSPYINHCHFHASYHMLQYLYHETPLQPPANHPNGKLSTFSQSKYLPSGYSLHSLSLLENGYIYIPKECINAHCSLHVAFHGCSMGYDTIGLDFISHSQLIQVADTNRIIVVFPQVTNTTLPYNPYGCWDWWGYSSATFAIRSAPQMTFVMNVVQALLKNTFITH